MIPDSARNWIAANAVQQFSLNKRNETKNMTTLHLRESIGRSPLRLAFLLIPLALACFALSPGAQAVSPPPDGGYPGGNTAEGTAALRDLTTGTFNTAVGNFSLTLNTEGDSNTGVGASALRNNTTGTDNTAVGADALNRNTTGGGNTANGSEALKGNTTGTGNTAVGAGALLSNTEGIFNTAIGSLALTSNIGNGEINPLESEGNGNTAVGSAALAANTIGKLNTAVGAGALAANTGAEGNTAVGALALTLNTDGEDNTAVGDEALSSNTSGERNTAVGSLVLAENTTGAGNTAVGDSALGKNTTGGNNTVIGDNALSDNTDGGSNTATGNLALAFNTTGNRNTAVGDRALFFNTTGADNIAVGSGAGKNVKTAGNTICIGAAGTNESDTCFIGNIFGNGTPAGVSVLISENGRLGTLISSKRFKEDIQPMDKASEALFSLKPVSFRYKKEIDPAGIPQLGLVAEDVEKVNPESNSARQRGKTLQRALRAGERDVAQRVSKGAPHSARIKNHSGKTGGDNRAAAKRNGRCDGAFGRAGSANPESERTGRDEPDCAANRGQQSVNLPT